MSQLGDDVDVVVHSDVCSLVEYIFHVERETSQPPEESFSPGMEKESHLPSLFRRVRKLRAI
ncbi:MAG: hypothetical protein LBV12_08525 [Puniceicoccales bacterium]|nr:hypothetical protein [Puniceicoccales bacterium]